MPTEGDDDRLLLARQHRRSWLRRSCPDVRNRATALPLANSLLVDAVALCERSQALLTILYHSTDRLRRRGASMKNLAHSASFHSTEKIAPSKAGIKHLRLSHQEVVLAICVLVVEDEPSIRSLAIDILCDAG